ncbi:phytoene desaturase family protein [Paenisporosarcina sp.]|uniref:phytoene desaturase family protein n=1 Tax=Paenisporosarcina sp. TaxID=1932001 RepID=UPI003C75FD30
MYKYDVAIIGGGLAGMTAANFLVKEGKKVVVLEKSNRVGGRAITNNKNGVLMNLGVHALTIDGKAMNVLTELGISIPGENASVKTHGIWRNKVYPIPTNFTSVLSSKLLTWKGKIVYLTLMLKLMKSNFDSIPEISLSDWAEREINDPMVRHIFYSLCRVSTYISAPTLQLAKPVLMQVKHGLNKGVMYVDGGWETIIQKLKKQAIESGAEIFYGKKVIEVEHHEQYQSIRCSDGELYHVPACIIAAPPKETLKMVTGSENTSLSIWVNQTIPITASCLDLGVKKLPNPENQFAIGLDQTYYFTNQSRAAKLSEDNTLVVSLVKYHNPMHQSINPQENKVQLETVMDLLHADWRNEVVVKQFLPEMTVVHDFPHVKRIDNPGPEIPQMKGIYIAGDWCGQDEILADAAVESGKRAALQILATNEPK